MSKGRRGCRGSRGKLKHRTLPDAPTAIPHPQPAADGRLINAVSWHSGGAAWFLPRRASGRPNLGAVADLLCVKYHGEGGEGRARVSHLRRDVTCRLHEGRLYGISHLGGGHYDTPSPGHVAACHCCSPSPRPAGRGAPPLLMHAGMPSSARLHRGAEEPRPI